MTTTMEDAMTTQRHYEAGQAYLPPTKTATLILREPRDGGDWSVEFTDATTGRIHRSVIGKEFLGDCSPTEAPPTAHAKPHRAAKVLVPVEGPVGTELAVAPTKPDAVLAVSADAFDRFGLVVPPGTSEADAVELLVRLDAVGAKWQMSAGRVWNYLTDTFPDTSRQRIRERFTEAYPDAAERSLDTYSNLGSVARKIGPGMEREFPTLTFGIWQALCSPNVTTDKRRRELARRAATEDWTRDDARREVRDEYGRQAIRDGKAGATKHTADAYDAGEAAARAEALQEEARIQASLTVTFAVFDADAVMTAVADAQTGWTYEMTVSLRDKLNKYVDDWDALLIEQGKAFGEIAGEIVQTEFAGRDKDDLVYAGEEPAADEPAPWEYDAPQGAEPEDDDNPFY